MLIRACFKILIFLALFANLAVIADITGKSTDVRDALNDSDPAVQAKNIQNLMDAMTCLNRANAYLQTKQYDKAIEDISKIIELKPNKSDDDIQKIAYFIRGGIYATMQQHDKAILDYSKGIELKPDQRELLGCYFCRGNSYAEMKQYDKAILDYSKAIELKPDYAAAYRYRGWVYSEMKQYDKAIQDYSKVIELKPDDADAYYGRACVYASMKQCDKAIQDCSKVIALKPDCGNTYLGIMEISIVTAKPELFGQALKQFETAIPEDKLSKEDLIIKLYLVCLNKCVLNEPRMEIENQLETLLKEKIELNWDFELTDEWLDNPKNGLTPEQIKYMRGLTDKIKATQKNLK